MGTADAQDAGQINIICSVQAEWCNMLQTVYARTTGVKVNMSLKGQIQVVGTLVMCSYLGSVQKLSLATELGEIFVVSHDVARNWQAGETLTLRLAEKGVSIVASS